MSTETDQAHSAFGDLYVERVGKPVAANTKTCFAQLTAFVLNGHPFGEKVLTTITEDDLEMFMASLRADGKAASTRNKYVQTIKMLFRWAERKGYISRNPAAHSEVLKREKHAQRNRRLEPDEEARIFEQAGPHLQRLIIAALETGCRKGELVSLQWRDVNLTRKEITIRAERTKTKTGRVLPVSERLLAVLKMAKTNPAGEDFEADDYVFGDTVGRQVKEIKRAWETAVLKAHRHTPTWARDHSLSLDSRTAFRAIDLHFHDLRHEAGSRFLEAGWELHHVSHMLGHANISQTSTYLNATRVGLQASMRRLDDARCNPVAKTPDTDRAPLRNEAESEQPEVTIN